MVSQYPHTLTYTTGATDSSLDENHHVVPGAAGAPVSQPCRYEALRENSRFRGVDNETRTQQGTIYMPRTATQLPAEGAYVEVIGMYKGPVGKPYVGQLNISIKV